MKTAMLLDAFDQKILAELKEDARIPLATLANKINLSRHAVRQRIDRLEAHKIISGYTIKTTQAQESELVHAVLLVYRKDRMRGADVTTHISRIPEIYECVVLSGDLDLLVQIKAKNHIRVNEIWAELSSLSGVQNIVTSFVLSSIVK